MENKPQTNPATPPALPTELLENIQSDKETTEEALSPEELAQRAAVDGTDMMKRIQERFKKI
jgi:hypothetical protein